MKFTLIILALLMVNNCNTQVASDNTSLSCDGFEGAWRTNEFDNSLSEEQILKYGCYDKTCGNFYTGPLKIECKNGKVSGSLLLSRGENDEGKKVSRYASVKGYIKNSEIHITYTDREECLVNYIAKREGEKLIGEYFVEGCKNKRRWIRYNGKRGKFIAFRMNIK